MELPVDFIESIKNQNELVATQHDQAAAMLYRLMFRHEKDLNILDHYADTIFDGIFGFGGDFAEEDYRNYIQYIKCINSKEAEWYQKQLDEELKKQEDDVLEDN
ncbi:hypothetical protein [Fibrobacter sp. UWB12]|uniref:hypothetical protein n=1 Tax=Fibrobacter sp. UWB12 TaxID=1896203 RepID=UPI0009201CD8|nr:hypothetical protein [Fibrobacter sp. UWB12]SHK42994.1 hypothetical protein SAMN05720759_102447 [Fibrobacter sp. UWB12]